jgi:hypothetical protein
VNAIAIAAAAPSFVKEIVQGQLVNLPLLLLLGTRSLWRTDASLGRRFRLGPFWGGLHDGCHRGGGGGGGRSCAKFQGWHSGDDDDDDDDREIDESAEMTDRI